MPRFNFDLQDGKPPVGVSLKPEEAERFMSVMSFMSECQALKAQPVTVPAKLAQAAVDALDFLEERYGNKDGGD